MKLIVIDTETSDLYPEKGAQILELAWTEIEQISQGWRPVFSTSYYIQYSGPISPHAQAVHHISADKLSVERGAISKEDGIRLLSEHMQPDSIMVAHNAKFDASFLPEVNRQWICTMQSAKHIWPEAPGYSNQVLRYWLKINPVDIDPTVETLFPHQARYDVATTTGILLKMLEKHTIDQLLIMSNAPVRLKTISFGKHRGTPFDQLPKDYLQWLRGQANLDNDLKHTIDSIIQK